MQYKILNTTHTKASFFNTGLFCVLLLLTLLSSQSFAGSAESHKKSSTLRPFVATYMITAMGLEGINVTNSLSISKKSQAYQFKSYSMPIGLLAFKKDETRDEQSEGLFINGTIQPQKYTFLQIRNNKTRRDVELKFDWLHNAVSNNHKHKKNKWTMPIPAQTIDKLSYQLALMLKLAHDPKRSFGFHIADGGKLKEYYFEILGEERVYTSLGSYKAVKIQHKRYKKGKMITLWCAPELEYLPVKIIQEETGKPTFVSTLISYQEGMTHNE
ncbi:DUF3108 domain-containing protein [sulfur-oxidizing endosymbiont of Gigantopelta aegis]|uniref:DUF3108 domain-containing protein n=1 Tax=sulfur-oxidizing endosymbiont of Gigantopelta aegis TaxID=2794934 RepID=UPI0018DCE8A1|nr:DUF3108 domain-containing protein [sulfur-oxidizing endosymbiont of Gigantopelta aegis]